MTAVPIPAQPVPTQPAAAGPVAALDAPLTDRELLDRLAALGLIESRRWYWWRWGDALVLGWIVFEALQTGHGIAAAVVVVLALVLTVVGEAVVQPEKRWRFKVRASAKGGNG